MTFVCSFVPSSVYELCIWSFSSTVLVFDGIPSFKLSVFLCQIIALYLVLGAAFLPQILMWKTKSLSFIFFLSCASPCLTVVISSVSPHPTEMTEDSVTDARVMVYLPQTTLGAFQREKQLFSSCFSSGIRQQIKSVCLCIVFYIISGQESLVICFPL